MEGRLYQISCSGCFFGAEQVNKCDEKATKLKDEDKHKYKNGRSLTLLVVPRKDCTDCNRIQSAWKFLNEHWQIVIIHGILFTLDLKKSIDSKKPRVHKNGNYIKYSDQQIGPTRIHNILPWRLRWNIIMEVWKIIFLSKWVICRFHVNLPGCIFSRVENQGLLLLGNFLIPSLMESASRSWDRPAGTNRTRSVYTVSTVCFNNWVHVSMNVMYLL